MPTTWRAFVQTADEIVELGCVPGADEIDAIENAKREWPMAKSTTASIGVVRLGRALPRPGDHRRSWGAHGGMS